MAFGDDWKKKNDFVLGTKGKKDRRSAPREEQDVTQKLRETMDEMEPMIEKINNLYSQYIAGVELIPPNAQRSRLDALDQSMTRMVKTTPALKFRYDTLHNRYISYRDRWDKQLRDLEAGKIGGARRGKKVFF